MDPEVNNASPEAIAHLGRSLANAQDEAFSSRPLPPMPVVPAPRRTAPMLLAAAACVVALLALWNVRKPNTPSTTASIAFEVDGARMERTDSWIASDATSTRSLRFSEGSALSLQAHTRVRVLSVTAHGARVQLERGALEVSVHHRNDTQWLLEAGPYTVQVTGTRFLLSWDPGRERIEVQMHEGSVLVQGPGIEGPRRLSTRARFVYPAEEAPLAATTPTPAPANENHAPETPRVRAPRVRTSNEDWVALAREGAFEEALNAAERVGIRRIARDATEEELLLLADAARYAHRAPVARSLYETARQRFRGRASSARAAFALGRIAIEQGNAWDEAAHWFELAAQEQPNGPLAREALGRQLEALQRSGAHDRARSLARTYLARYPEGPAASLARSLSP